MRASPAYTVSVRELCAFTAKTGDLDLRFTPSPTAQEGIIGHRLVASRRPPGWCSEVSLSGGFESVNVRGRADGIDPEAARLEEVKTCRGGPERVPGNHRALHWAQAETYAHLHASKEGAGTMTVSLVYFDIATQCESVLDRQMHADALRARFEDRCRRFAAWAASEAAHRDERNRALVDLRFAHTSFRPGQRELAQAVFRGAREGRCVLAQAPTGIGKTVGTLYPALKALATERLDKVFFLTARTPGRQVALDGLRTIAGGRTLPLRVIELVAREQACEHPGQACHGEACPLAKGFYDRLPAARQAAVESDFLDRERVRTVAHEHAVCPYYLAQELVKWSDVVVGDYNHYFDATAMLHGMTQAQEWRVLVLVDEAHNLVERGRAMYSTVLSRRACRRAARHAPAEVKRALDPLSRAWGELLGEGAEPYRALERLPTRFVERLDTAVGAIAAFQAEHPEGLDPTTLQLFFDLGRFSRLAASFGTHALADIIVVDGSLGPEGQDDALLSIRNVVPAAHLAARFCAAASVTLFSATLSPVGFYREMLGLPASAVAVAVGSPFTSAQLQVRTAHGISTRFGDRAASVAPIAALIGEQFARAPGNYIAFFSSFTYLEQVADAFARARPEVPIWRQAARMSDAEQKAFLARFTPEGEGVGFAVLGGRFAEGIDLPGRRLVGAFVATLGLPQVNPVNEAIRKRIEQQFGRGYEYTYLYPGLRKVVQAAGRVIRTTSDRGVLHLIDDRFSSARVKALLPSWWRAGVEQ